MEQPLSLLGPVPIPLTSFFGRDDHIVDILQRLRTPAVRLVSLIGPGGVGKTRLAIEVEHQIGAHFPDGVVFLSLAQLRDPAQFLQYLATTLGLRDSAERRAVDHIPSFLASRRALLMFDNFEQILPHAARDLAALLSRCPALTALVTSRFRLLVNGEYVVSVPPLPLPSDDETSAATMSENAAVQLFCDRSRASGTRITFDDHDIARVVAICRRLDGLPLAIEMAAAWTRAFSLAALLERLDQRLPLLLLKGEAATGRRSMRDVVAWSYDLLSPEQQRIVTRLSAFAGSFSLDAALSINAEDDEAGVLGAILDLVDRSLLSSERGFDEQARFSMLGTIREYVREQLDASGDAEMIAARHLAWYASLSAELGSANRWTPHLIERLHAERDNLALALQTSLAVKDYEASEFLISALGRYWLDAGNFREAQTWYERIFELAPLPPNDQLRGLTSRQFGIICWYQGAFREAEIWLMRALALHTLLDDAYEIARDKNYLASIAETKGDIDLAIQHFRDAHAVFAALGDEPFAALMLEGISDMEYRRGNLVQAHQVLNDALAIARRVDNPIILGVVLGGQAQVLSERGDLEGAWNALDESLDLHDLDPSPTRLSDTLAGYARAAGLAGDSTVAVTLLGKVAAMLASMGTVRVEHFEQHARALARARELSGEDEEAFASAFQRGQTLSDRDAKALARDRTWLHSGPRAQPQSTSAALKRLSRRELEVLRLMADGFADREIAETLGLSYRTITTYVTGIFTKLNVSSRAAAVSHAWQENLFAG